MTASPALIAVAAIWLLSVVSLFRGFVGQYAAPTRSWSSYEVRRLLNVLPFLVSVLIFGSGIYILLSHSYTSEDRRWGYAIVGTIAGYWLRGTIR